VSDERILADLPQTAPADAANARLVANVRPPGWANPAPRGRYHLVVVGAGTAGLVTAMGAAGLGARVALVERQLLGGDCLNVGCVPSKALLASARAAARARAAPRLGVDVERVEVDFPRVMLRMRDVRADISRHDSAARFRDAGVDVFIGAGRFTAPDALEVEGARLAFSRACIATGARAVALPIPGLAEVDFLTNETLFSLTELPRRLAVIGAGPIGCEMAQAFARFGSAVTLFEIEPRVLGREDPDAAALVERALAADGVELLTSARVARMRATRAGGALVDAEVAGAARPIEVDRVLLAVGRAPNVEGLGLDAAGVAHDQRGVLVDDRLRTSNKRVYAAGDIASAFKFTHSADALARIVIGNALFFGRARASALTIPWSTYTDPEVAHVGLYPEEAAERGIALDTYRVERAEVDRAVLDGETDGFAKLHAKKGKDKLLGATIVGPDAGSLICEVAALMRAGAGLAALAATIHPYPTQAEILKKAGDAYNRTRLTPFAAKLLRLLLKLKARC
jgi:pyruvate/2-oxoglutarate dehydrogenase complex dihydrolipoamide dehydrogenase (E3) component